MLRHGEADAGLLAIKNGDEAAQEGVAKNTGPLGGGTSSAMSEKSQEFPSRST
jgi:hypothetical protein